MSHAHNDSSHCCAAELTADSSQDTRPLLAGHEKSTLRIEQMDCPTEERLIRDRLQRNPHVSGLHFNLLERLLQVHHAPGQLDSVVADIGALGMQAVPLRAGGGGPAMGETTSKSEASRLVAAGLLAAVAEGAELMQADSLLWTMLPALLSVLLIGGPIIRKGWIAIINRNLNINALMSIAVTGAFLIGHWPEAAMVTFLFALAELIEARSLTRARDAVRSLMVMTPETALVQQADASWQEQTVAEVAIGSLIRLAPGERVALDGEIVEGNSAFDQSSITGESLPVELGVGERIHAGSLNTSHEVLYRSTALADDSLLARIMHRVQEAQASQAPTQRFVDAFARIYTPVVVVIAVLVALLPPLFAGGNWLDWLYSALVLLVIACPCALVISTPVAVVSALAQAARSGILIKGGVYLEQARKLDMIAFDKTGTLTAGRPQLMQYQALAGTSLPVEQLAASLAARSDHPVSHAIAAGLAQPQLLEVSKFAASAGRGVQGVIDGRQYYLGNERMLRELQLLREEDNMPLAELQRQGLSVSLLADDSGMQGWFAVQDPVKPTTADAVRQLQQLGLQTLMLSGDNRRVADSIGAAAGIGQVHAELLPEDKLEMIGRLQQQGRTVAMVGDGINDAPALARADIGVAMGAAGTDTAVETADVALMDDDLRKLPQLIRLSRRTAVILQQNISVALGLKVVFLLLAFVGKATMWMAVFADAGASLLVTLNSLRLLRKKAGK